MEIWSSHYIILLFKECSNFSQSPEAGKKKKQKSLVLFTSRLKLSTHCWWPLPVGLPVSIP